MTPETIDNTTKEIGKSFLKPLGFLQVIFFLCVLLSVFAFIWSTWQLGIKILLTGIFGILISKFLYKIIYLGIKEAIEKEVEKYEVKPEAPKSKFMQRLEKAMKEAGELKKSKE